MAAQSQPPPTKEWTEMIQPYIQSLDNPQKGLCHVLEWIREDLPLETQGGGTVIKECETMLNHINRPRPPTREYLEKLEPNQGKFELAKPPPPEKEKVLVFEDSFGFTKAVLSNAPEGRVGTKRVVEGPWDKYGMEEVRTILSEKPCSMILFGATCDIPRSNRVQDVIDFQATVMELAFYVVKCIIVHDLPVKKLCFLTRGMFEEGKELHEQVGLSLITFATMFGFCNTARLELEETAVMLIDTEYFLKPPFWQTTDFQLAQRLASEVWRTETFGINTVRVLNKGRYVARQLLAHPYAEASGMQFQLPGPGQIVAISGGNGSLGIIMAGWLVDQAEKQGKRGFEIQMLSRSCTISDENMKPFNKVLAKAARLDITYVHTTCNLTHQEAADEYVQSTNGRLFGFIHSSGILQDSMIPGMDWQKFEAVWNPKHRAALYLHDAFQRIPNVLSFFWMFSSSAVYGNMGQLNYSASNAAMDGLARHRRALGKAGQTMQWGGWGEVGMAANMDAASKRRMENGPMPMFTNMDGLTGMEIGLKCNVATFSVYKMNPRAMFDMTTPDETSTQSYLRNFSSEYVPPPQTTPEPKHAYALYRSILFPQAWNPNRDMLTWESYVAPLMDKEHAPTYSAVPPGCSIDNFKSNTPAE